MNPDQANWQQQGESQQTSLTIECRQDGTVKLTAGSFSYEGDMDGASDAFRALIEHGQEQAQGS
jgi:hypothetical protein